jgi:hypothetical protein
MTDFTHADDIATNQFPSADAYPVGAAARGPWRVPRRVRPWRALPFAELSFPAKRTNFRYGWRVARTQMDVPNTWPRQGTRKGDLDVVVYAECRLDDEHSVYLWKDYWRGVDAWRFSPFNRHVLVQPPWPLYDYPTQ